jgi:DNA polymerase III subunit chi
LTEISFHTKVPDVLGYACRLLRKASRKGSFVVVTAEAAVLQQLDQALWRFDPLDFVPHIRVAPGANVSARLRSTPIWLTEPGAPTPVHDVLVNLAPEVAPGFEAFERVIEVVGRDDVASRNGRQRWRHYVDRGYAIKHHEASAA